MPDEQLYCVVCANFHTKENGRTIMGRIFVCRPCNDTILELYLLTNPIKWLCPHCKGASGSNCLHCDLRIMLRRANTLNR